MGFPLRHRVCQGKGMEEGLGAWGAEPTCSSEARLENMGMISLLTLSSSSTLANSPSLEAAARRTMGVSSEHRFRKYLGVGSGTQEEEGLARSPQQHAEAERRKHRFCSHASSGFA